MSSQTESPSNGERLSGPSSTNVELIGAASTFVVGLLIFGVLFGFRGLDGSAVDLLEGARRLLSSLGQGVNPRSLATSHPGADWLFALTLRGAPGSGQLAWWPMLTIGLGALSLPAVWGIGKKLAGPTGGVVAAVTFALLPAVSGAATATGAPLLFLFAWAWFLRLLVVERHRWFSIPPLWLLGGVLVLIYPAFLVWGLAWLYIELRRSERTELRAERPLDGEVAAGGLPLAILLAPVAVIAVATALHPGFWSNPVDGWKRFFEFALTNAAPTFQYAGTVYEHARPPLWTGGILYWWFSPALLAVGAGVGWMLAAFDTGTQRGRTAELTRSMVLWGLPLALLAPWLTRGTAYGSIEFTLVAAPFAAVLVGWAVVRFAAGLEGLLDDGPDRSTIAASFGALLVVALIFPSAGAQPAQGSYYNGLAGGYVAAVERGLPTTRDGVVPITVLREAGAKAGKGGVYVVGNSDLVDLYVKNGWLGDVTPRKSAYSSGALLRRVGAFEPGREDVLRNESALVDLSADTVPLMRVDGIPFFWLEPQTTP